MSVVRNYQVHTRGDPPKPAAALPTMAFMSTIVILVKLAARKLAFDAHCLLNRRKWSKTLLELSSARDIKQNRTDTHGADEHGYCYRGSGTDMHRQTDILTREVPGSAYYSRSQLLEKIHRATDCSDGQAFWQPSYQACESFLQSL